ncbi:MAG: T9SS type A sorting domain-containing protein [Bacteroidales bacterium]|nr:T9SS type A sorting domain-containing protein [Bacteroidales bacterium]
MVKLGRLVLLCAVLSSAVAQAQNIDVTSAMGQNIATFINNNLIGQGVYVSNVKFANAAGNITKPMIGTFQSNGFPHLQMDSGVVMTTGNVDVAEGPNSSTSLSNSVAGAYWDSQLNTYLNSGLGVSSCSTLDFDFVSISPYVTLNYCFGSEEYPEFVCSSYNDIFAFLVTGPDPVTGQTVTKNIAIIPHTVSTTNPNGITVAINTVNNGYNDNPSDTNAVSGCTSRFSQFYVSNTFPTGVQYDGFTQKLSANATLVPCTQYHMHISICNVGTSSGGPASDVAYDSGVFLEKNSFNSPSAEVSLSHRYADTIERSKPLIDTLTLAESSYNSGNVMVSFGGNAVVGQDYTVTLDGNQALDEMHPTFVVDQNIHTLTFRGTATANLTTPKLIELYLATSLCEGYPALKTFDTIRYLLAEDDVVRLRDTTIVAYDTCKQVGVEVALGQPPLSFHWIPEDNIDHPYQQHSTATITRSCDYRVAVADSRGHKDTADVHIDVRPRTNDIPDDQQVTAEVSIYPNPTDGEMNIEADGITHVEVFDAQGRRVFSRRCNSDCRTLNICPLPAGLYTVRVITNIGIKTEKVIVR